MAWCSSTAKAVSTLEDSEFARVGRQFEHHPFFPRRVNTEFILPFLRDRLRMRAWGRGSGETLACGTAACTALVAAVLTGRAEGRATLELRGGKLGSNGVSTARTQQIT